MRFTNLPPTEAACALCHVTSTAMNDVFIRIQTAIYVTCNLVPSPPPQLSSLAYEERVREVEHGSFSPLIFSTSGGMGPIATVVYKRIATLIAEKRDQPYSRTLFWIRCKLSFSLLRSAIMCIRGSRSSYHHPAGMIGEAIDLTCSEGRIVSSQ